MKSPSSRVLFTYVTYNICKDAMKQKLAHRIHLSFSNFGALVGAFGLVITVSIEQ